MQAVVKHHEYITQATSDDGRLTVTHTPTTRLVGYFHVRDNVTGEMMSRRVYLDSQGKETDRAVPADVWATYCALTNEIDALNGAAEDASTASAHVIADARYSAVSERVAADMDRPGSDL